MPPTIYFMKPTVITKSCKLPDGRETKVYETDKAWHLPEIVTKKDKNGIRIGRTILQRPIAREEVMQMLAEGKTGLLKGFVSNRTKRKFDAMLTFEADSGKIGFEFEPRAKKAAKTKS